MLLQLFLGRRERRRREDDAADRMQTAILDSAGAPFQRSIARVSARRTRASSNGFFLWFGVTRLPQFQIALLHRDLVAERADELVARGGRQVREIDRGAVAADGVDPDGLLGGIDAGEAVEVRQPSMIIIRVALLP